MGRRRWGNRTHVTDKARRNAEPRQSKAVTDFLQDATGRSKSRRADERPTADINDRADDGVCGENPGEASEHGAVVVFGLFHLAQDGEECRDAGVGEYDGRDGGHGAYEIRVAD